MDGKSLDIAEDKKQQLKQLFPEIFSEDQIDLDKLKQVLGEESFAGPERYELSWAGKSEAFKEIQKQTTATLVPDREGSVNFDTSENIFIEGENLEVLRALQRSYYGKVKMIYIDPPYNTGNDHFVYPDDFAERLEEYQKRAGIKDEEGFLNKQDLWKKNTKENGQFHSVWLSMMYPRLYLARNLLREDGVIFVNIDDTEVANLRLMLDSVFGAENFVSNVVWQKKYAVSNDDTGISPMHDHILVYQKSTEFERNLLPRTDKQLKRYKNIDNDPRGLWSSDNYVSNKSKRERPTLYYPIIHPKTGKEVFPNESAVWRYSKDKHEQMVRENRLYWGPDLSYEKPRLKRFLSEIQQGIVPSTWWTFEEVGHNDEGQKETARILGNKIFSTPKPVRLMKRIMELSTSENDCNIVVDFFSGSGALGHAVMDMNVDNGGNRQFILVQMPEATEDDSPAKEAGYNTIADIAKSRIQKVVEQINHNLDKVKAEKDSHIARLSNLEAELSEILKTAQLDLEGNSILSKEAKKLESEIEKIQLEIAQLSAEIEKIESTDRGFRSYRLAPSNFKTWRSDISGKEALTQQLEVFRDSLKPKTDQESLVYELLLKAGLPLTAKVERRSLEHEGKETSYYLVENGRLLFALNGFNQSLIQEILTLKPRVVITLDSLFEADDAFMTNTSLQFKDADIEFKVI